MNKEKKVVLVLLPFWNSLIPRMGISSLKSYLKEQGCNAKAIDANVQPKFREFYDKYLTLLKQSIPPGKRGNFYNTAGTVLQKHLLAHLGQDNEDEYREAVLAIISQYYFERVGDDAIEHLISVVIKFYQYLETYLLALLEQEKPHVIGFSVYSDTLPASLFAAQVTKDYDPNIQVVIGGGIFTEDLAYGSTNFTNFLEHTPMIDNIFVGESEILFSKYLQGQLPGNQKAFTLEDVQGQTLDLDTAPIPDFSGFELEYYPNLSAYTSRSCPFQCAFCSESFFWGKYRKKSTTRIVEELTQLYKQHGCRLFLMCDSLLNPVANGLAEALANSELSLYWDGYLRADKPVTKPDNTFKWRQGGFYRARLGLESGSDRLLQVMGKGITAQQIREALSSLAQAGIKTTTYWVIGYPGETEEDFQQTLDLVKEMKMTYTKQIAMLSLSFLLARSIPNSGPKRTR